MSEIKILVADDIFSNQLLLKSIIEDAGYYCKVVSNGKKAIEELRKSEYKVFFTDIEMPVMNGMETVKYIRQHFLEPQKNMPVIALTAHNLSDFEGKTDNIGFSDIITKPYSVEKFKKVLEEYIKND